MTNAEALEKIEDYSGFEHIINLSIDLDDEEADELLNNAHHAYWELIQHLKANQDEEE
jgi:hypothetical protein